MTDRERCDRARLALRDIEGNLAFTDHEAWAWFVLPTQPWAFRSDAQREQLILGTGEALAWLAGHRVHLRVTTRPYPAADFGTARMEVRIARLVVARGAIPPTFFDPKWRSPNGVILQHESIRRRRRPRARPRDSA